MKRIVLVMMMTTATLHFAAGQTKPYRGAEYRTIASQTYGRFEVRMKSANVSGMLSSFFTYYDPASPWNEIDIETMGRYTNEIQFNTIVPTSNNNHVQRQVVSFNPHEAFHVVGFEWTPDYVAWLVDGDEVYRQTGNHITQLAQPMKVMMNIWQPTYVDWAGSFSAASLPVYAYYDWVKYYAYTPGSGDNFTLQWTDDMDSFDTARWAKATHTWDGNNAQFVTANAVHAQGYLVLCLTSNTLSGYSGGPIPDEDVDPPFAISARAFDSTIVVHFSEPVSAETAENTTHYSGNGITVLSAQLQPSMRDVVLSVQGMHQPADMTLTVQGIQDRSTPGHTSGTQQIAVISPLSLPIAIDVGGNGGSGFLADSTWYAGAQYGRIGGTVSSIPTYLSVSNTTEQSVYHSSVHGVSGYRIRVPNGSYNVKLMMVEDHLVGPGKRVFSAHVEGNPLLTNFDLFQQAGILSAYEALATSVQVTDNVLDIWLDATADSTTLSGIILEREGGSTGVNDGKSETVSPRFSVFPNPSNGSAVFSFNLPSPSSAKVVIYDVIGREIDELELGPVTSGDHNVPWSTGSLASGTYFCTLRTANVQMTRKFMLIR